MIRAWIETHFVHLLVVSFLAALFLPGLEHVPSEWATYAMATIIFFACSKIHLDDVKSIPLSQVGVFYLGRFIVLPALVYFAFAYAYSDLKEAVLLMMLVPAGVMVPAVCMMMKGNVSMGLGGVVLSSLLAPLLVPTFFEVFGYEGVEIDTLDMFIKLCIMILFPIVIYFTFVRRLEPVKLKMRENASAYSVIMINIVFACVIAQQRDVFFDEPLFVLTAFLCSGVVFFLMYGFGWVFGFRTSRANRISFALISGANNMALAIALGTLLFPDVVSQYMVVAEVNWILFLPLFKSFLAKTEKRA